MKKYRDISGKSGVTAWDAGADFIRVRFHGPEIYTYNYIKPGEEVVERMKELAVQGRGLSTYISQHVRNNYFDKTESPE